MSPVAACGQCGRPALYVFGPEKIPLCMEHAALHQQIMDRQIAALDRQREQALDDMEAITGVSLRPPRPQPVSMVRPTFHAINIKDSTVGLVNQGGNLKNVDVAVNVIGKAGDQALANALITLIEAAVNHAAVPAAQKMEAVEILSVLASESAVPKNERRSGAARPLLHRLRQILGVSADLAALVAPALEVMKGAFGL